MTWTYILYKTLGTLATPPGIFIFLTFSGALFFLKRKEPVGTRRLGASFFLLFLSLSLYLFSIPWSVRALLSPLEESFSFDLPSPRGQSVVMVLSGGVWSSGDALYMSAETLQRFAAGVRAADSLRCPLLFAGGYPGRASEEQILRMVQRTARDLKFDGPLLVEGNSRTTWENMKLSAPFLRTVQAENIVLVTSAYHMHRSLDFARRFFPGHSIHPYPSGRLSEAGPVHAMEFLPSSSSFQYLSAGIREVVGLQVYRLFPAQGY